MTSIVFGLLTAVFFATSALCSSRAVKIIGSWSAVAWAMLVGLLVTLPFLFASGVPAAVGENIGWMLVTGLGNATALVLAGLAFRVGKVGVITPILATEGAISAVIASLLGESIAPIVAFLLFVIVIGIVISAIAPDPEPLDHERPALAVALATAGAVAFGISLFTAGHLSGDLPISWVLLPARLVGVVALTIPLALTRNLRITRGTVPLVIAMGLAEVIGFTCFAIGAQYEVAITSVLASQFAPIAAVMAYVLFREKLGRLQITGVAILVVGVAALSIAS
ncbi:MAG: DMT family transporter [Actinobacteria bacterium]|nr:DMT family transporter [Actinomycetota bacterium]